MDKMNVLDLQQNCAFGYGWGLNGSMSQAVSKTLPNVTLRSESYIPYSVNMS